MSQFLKATSRQVGQAGEMYVAAEINRRGGNAVTFAGNIADIDLLAMNSLNTRRISIQVNTKGPGSSMWQTSTTMGRAAGDVPEDEREGRFWVLVDLKPAHPIFYVMPEWWVRDDIDRAHRAMLARQPGGVRRDTPDSTHHAITIARVAQWKDDWLTLGIFESTSITEAPPEPE